MPTKVQQLGTTHIVTSKRVRAARIQKARQHDGFGAFLELVIKADETNQPIKIAPHQQEWIEFLHERIDWDWLTGKKQLFDGRYLFLLAHFKSGKTPIIAKGLPLWLLYHNPNLRLSLICNSEQNAKNRCMSIGQTIEMDRDYQDFAPGVRRDESKSWNQLTLNIGRTGSPNEHTLQSFSINSSRTGLTVDILLLDDVCDEDDLFSSADRNRKIKKFHASWMNRLRPGGGMVCGIGTKWHANDLYEDLIRNPMFDFMIQAVSADNTHIEQPPEYFRKSIYENVVDRENPKIIPLWSHMPKSEMDRRQTTNPAFFNAGFRQRPQLDEEQIFDSEAVDRMFNWDICWADIVPTNKLGRPTWLCVTGVDLSGKERPGTVIATGAFNPESATRVMLSIRKGTWGFGPQAAKEIYQDYLNFAPETVAIEDNAAQKALVEWLEKIYGADFPARGYRTGENKQDPELGVPRLAADINRDVWIVPMGDILTHRRKIATCHCGRCSLRRDLLSYPGGTQDCFPAGSLVLTECGYKPIEDVQAGELVMTHKRRFRQVEMTREKDWEDDILTVDSIGHMPYRATAGHRIFSSRRFPVNAKSSGGSYRYQFADPEWVSLQDIEKWDTDYKGRMSAGSFSSSFQETLHGTDGVEIGDNWYELDDDLCWLLGYYLAEGSCSLSGISFAMHVREQSTHGEKVKRIARDRFGIERFFEYRRGQKGNGLQLMFNSGIFRVFFRQFGSRTKKFMPWTIMAGLDKKQSIAVVRGWLDGDGCTEANRRSPRISAASISRTLLYQMRSFLWKNGIHSTVHNHPQPENGWSVNPCWKLAISGAFSYRIFPNQFEKPNRVPNIACHTEDGISINRIRSISRSRFSGKVYDLQVEEDQSFVVEDQVVSNCTMSMWQVNRIFNTLRIASAPVPIPAKTMKKLHEHRTVSDGGLAYRIQQGGIEDAMFSGKRLFTGGGRGKRIF